MQIRGISVSRQQLLVLLVVWLAFLLSFVDRLSLAPTLPLVAKDLGMSAKQAGGFMTAFYMGYVCTQLPGGFLTDKFGYRKVLLVSFFVMGVFTALMGTVTSYQMGFAYRLLAGIGSGAIFSACVRAIFDWFPPKGRGTAMGFFMTASSLGLTVVNLFVPAVARDHGWGASFFIAGALPIAALLLAVPFLKHNPESESTTQGATMRLSDILLLLKNKNLMLAALAGFGAMWGTWGTATWANTYMNKSLNLTLVQAGYFMSSYGLFALLGKPVSGIMNDILGKKRKLLLSVILLLFAVVLIWFGSNRSVNMLYFLAPLLGVVAFVYSPIMNTMIGDLADKKLVGTATGFVNTIWQMGSLLSPIVVGSVIDAGAGNYFYAFVTLAIGPVLAAAIILLVKE